MVRMSGDPSSELDRATVSSRDRGARAEPSVSADVTAGVDAEVGVLPATLAVTPGFRRRARHNAAFQAVVLRPGTFEAMPLRLACALLVVTLGIVFLADRATQAAPVQHLYYIPIIVAAIRLGWPGGLGAGFAAVVLYHLANPRVLTLQYE